MMDYYPYGSSSLMFVLGVFYLLTALAIWKMATRLKEEQAWFAIVPILNLVLLLKLAKKPLWWTILFFLPIVNLAALIMATMSLCERFSVEKWWGLLAIVSPFNLILYLYLAFGNQAAPPAHSHPPTTPTV